MQEQDTLTREEAQWIMDTASDPMEACQLIAAHLGFQFAEDDAE